MRANSYCTTYWYRKSPHRPTPDLQQRFTAIKWGMMLPKVPGLLQPLFGLFVRLKPHRVSLERPSSLPRDCVWGGFVVWAVKVWLLFRTTCGCSKGFAYLPVCGATRHLFASVNTRKFGRGERIRTSDPLPPRQVRYQAAPRPDFYGFIAVTGKDVHHPCNGRL